MKSLDALVPEWLTVPDLADELGTDAAQVRRMVEVREIVGVKRTERNIFSVPAAFIAGGAVVKNLKGTLTVLSDSGLTDAESIEWLFTDDDSLPGTPIDALRRGVKTEIRRRAQALAL
ncbi:Rv2175c family DNA-binding protein [Spelaeicoccus albus]|uniref:Rv2175c family DNA-binding protein n=1 Tax=Spelaeicoccus albus TaxID=1280376 RepID=UPI001EEECDE5|nr:Rv2175c family DNA-binding protein [Spelaeicoccus albus]